MKIGLDFSHLETRVFFSLVKYVHNHCCDGVHLDHPRSLLKYLPLYSKVMLLVKVKKGRDYFVTKSEIVHIHTEF
jgi:hypothetical protein